jgi:hypothetical protein
MPTLSALKQSVLSTLSRPNEGNKSRLGRRVISFDEALGNLKSAKTGVTPCAAFHRFGRCRKEVFLGESNFIANLNQLDMTDVQTPMKLMPLMLCSGHWGKTIYNNALFLDWLSIYGSKKDNEHFGNIVVDYQSAIAIDDEVPSLSNAPLSSDWRVRTQGRPTSAPSSPVKGKFQVELRILLLVETFRRTIRSNKFAEGSYMDSPRGPNDSQLIGGQANVSFLQSAPDHPATHVPEISVLMTMESYASIELGAARLEIIYQDDLKCIAMTSDGWRCQEIIQRDHLFKARQLLNKSAVADTELDMKLFSTLVLCPGHAQGDLSSIYCDKWTTFAEQRLSKEKAMAKFDAEFWMSVEFFRYDENEYVLSKNMRRPKSASNLQARQSGECGDGITKTRFLPPTLKSPFSSPSSQFEPSIPINWPGPQFTTTMSNGGVFASRTSTAGGGLESHSFAAPDSEPKDSPASASKSLGKLGIAEHSSHSGNSLLPSMKMAVDESVSLDETRNQEWQSRARKASSFKTPSLPPYPARSPEDIDQDMIQTIKSRNSPERCVYVFQSLNEELIRIGTATTVTHPPTSFAQARHCSLADLDRVEFEVIEVKQFHERVLSLVYLELANFRVQATCQHEIEGWEEEEHRQWFKVPGMVALQSIRLWREFVNKAYTSEGSMRDDWAKLYTSTPLPKPREFELLKLGLKVGDVSALNVHHYLRHERYENWIRGWEALVKQPKGAMTDGRPLKVIPVRLPGQKHTTKVVGHKGTVDSSR